MQGNHMHGGALDILGKIEGGIENPLVLRGPVFSRLRHALLQIVSGSFAVKPPEFTAYALIRHHQPAPALPVRACGA